MRLTLAFVSMIAAFLASATASQAADYTVDPTHSHVLFTIDHLGFAKMVGLFSDFSGNISFDANNVPASKLNVTIKTDSLQTQFAPRDKDLKGADWVQRHRVSRDDVCRYRICKKGRSHWDGYGKAHPAWCDQTGYAQRCRKQSRSEPA